MRTLLKTLFSPLVSPLAAALLLALALTVCLPEAALAQRKKKKKSTTDLEKLLATADTLYKQLRTVESEKLYRQALKQDPTNQHILARIAYNNEFMGKDEEAIKWFQSAIDVDPVKDDTLWFDLGQALKRTENYAESSRAFERFVELHKRNDYLLRQARLEIESNQFAVTELAKPAGWDLQRVNVSSRNSDYDPAVYTITGKRYLVFTSHRKGSTGKELNTEFGDEPFADLWVAPMTTDSTFGAPQNMGKMINTPAADGSASISPDGLTMYYSICGGGKLSRKFGRCSIFQSTFDPEKKKWNRFELVEGIQAFTEQVINNRGKTQKVPFDDQHPFISPDGNTLYFSSDRAGGLGDHDIWYATRAGNKWNKPLLAGRVINTEFDEIQPYIADDGALYFASDGHKGFGGYDIYRSAGNEATWEPPMNVGHPFNSAANELSILYLSDTTGLMTSDRTGGAGRDDIYYFRKLRPKPVAPVIVSIQGRVRDLKSRQIIPFSTVTLYQVTPDKNFIARDTFKTDQTGNYRFSLEKGSDYRLVGTAPEYLANEVFVSTKPIEKSTTLEADIDITLERIELNRPIVLQNIYYDFDKAELRPESVVELDKLVALLLDDPGITIQLGSHTDTNGPERYNVRLSNRRAQSVIDYIASKGVNKKRINWFGFGESQPLIYPEMSDTDEQANRRTEFRIQTFDLVVELQTPDKR